jgi:hypothetical protein
MTIMIFYSFVKTSSIKADEAHGKEENKLLHQLVHTAIRKLKTLDTGHLLHPMRQLFIRTEIAHCVPSARPSYVFHVNL